jgi:hypothetical protein
MVSILLQEYEIRCHFCGEQLTGESLYRNKSGKSIDDLCWHHLDGKHYNDVKGNRRFAHRKCHLKHHRQKEIKEYQEEVHSLLTEKEEYAYKIMNI